ncbi:unnamed protein product [Cyprideis torosa]|uniref:UDP-N-acetylglucosamine--dolichyl-phosphate N-acetylglucosaminephosphotransferase n=1 Tax=Cyprideis torosa TaxID=163714 RepID=A0A7R8ZJ30_9CRUS|nr:unnamed protein product [Cyprideis torosa]CAG0887663.1 unnamed protein product [Cyprideis torosa]
MAWGMGTLLLTFLFSVVGYFLTSHLIPAFAPAFLMAGICGKDLCKLHPSSSEQEKRKPIPESAGTISAGVYLVIMFLLIPPTFGLHFLESVDSAFPYHQFVEHLAALLSVASMVFLGFADDVLSLKWRHKLLLPTLAALPLLCVYLVNFNSTSVVVPNIYHLRMWIGHTVNLGPFYYVYMGLITVFCTNAINIYAGVNGLEAGQSLVIAFSIVVFNVTELTRDPAPHSFSLHFLLPFIGTTLALLKWNWFPARVFVGDTFCYFAGITFACVAVLGHFSKTVMLFFLPQLLNFAISLPQLFRLVPCPRHRLPRPLKTSPDIDVPLLAPSVALLPRSRPRLISLVERLGLLSHVDDGESEERGPQMINLTLINLVLHLFGPMTEEKLVMRLLLLQVLSSVFAFVVRYPLARLFYDN